jgi:hypothetical protein
MHWVGFAGLMSLAVASGYTSIAAKLMKSAFSDPRTKNHAYYAEVRVSFSLGGMRVVSTRHAEVGYLTGGTPDYRWPSCDETNPKCWYITDHFFVGLPNGDIVDIFVKRSNVPLMTMTIGQSVHTKGQFTFVLRNQTESPYAKEFGPCLALKDEALKTDYNITPPTTDDVAVRIDISVDITRVDGSIPKTLIRDPDDFYAEKTFDHEPCNRLAKTILGPTSINSE